MQKENNSKDSSVMDVQPQQATSRTRSSSQSRGPSTPHRSKQKKSVKKYRWTGVLLVISSVIILTISITAGVAHGSAPLQAAPDTAGPDTLRPETTVFSLPLALQEPHPNPLSWEACNNTEITEISISFECAKMTVPVDYDSPEGPSLDIALARVKATNPDERIGSLVMNPGGPGGSGVDLLNFRAGAFPASIRSRFDLVGFDPRGTNRSHPIDCHDAIRKIGNPPTTPETPQEWEANFQVAQLRADECQEKYGDLLSHIGTLETTYDLEMIRASLGDEKLSYLGYSYGTKIATYYATLFPNRTRALILDGAVHPSLDTPEIWLEQAAAFENSIQNFFAHCDKVRTTCNWTKNQKSRIAWTSLLNKTKSSPVPASFRNNKMVLSDDAILDITLGQMYRGKQSWDSLSRFFTLIQQGDEKKLGRFLVLNGFWKPNSEESKGAEAYYAVNCPEFSYTLSPQEAQQLTNRFVESSATFGLSFVTFDMVPCSTWPVRSAPHPRLSNGSNAPALVVSTTGDPATPHSWGKALSAYLHAPLLTYTGTAHVAHLGEGNACVDDTIHKFLITGETPEDSIICTPPQPQTSTLQTRTLSTPAKVATTPNWPIWQSFPHKHNSYSTTQHSNTLK